jgi:hypothetical protein
MNQLEAIFEVAMRVLCDIRPNEPAEGVYLFAQTEDNQASVFSGAQRLLNQALIRKIYLIKTGAKSGYPGFEAWRAQLLALKIDPKQLHGVEAEDTPSLNTLIEAQALIRFAKRESLTSLYVMAAPFHQIRAFMTAVTVALSEYPTLKIYSQPGATLPWHQEVSHSQGIVIAKRNDLIKGELKRIEKYQHKGDLAGLADVLDYINQRDL